MKLFFSVAWALLIGLGTSSLLAQSSDVVEIKYKDLSKEAKKALKTLSTDLCACLEEHGDGLKTMTDAMKPLLEKDEVDPMEMMGVMMASAADMEGFNSCMNEAEPNKDMEQVLDKELEKLAAGKELSNEEKTLMQMQMLNLGLEKNCKKQQPVFDDFMKTMIGIQTMMESATPDDFEEPGMEIDED